MASNNPVHTAYRRYHGIRKGMVTALTIGIDDILEKCRTVLPGAEYKDRYVLKGLEDGGYRVEHPIISFVGLPKPRTLPLYCGKMTEKIWLCLAMESSNAWLCSTIMYITDTIAMNDNHKLRFFDRIMRLPELESEILHYHHKHPRAEPVTPTALSMVEELSPCENISCFFVSNKCWIQCVICSKWYHCACVGVSPADRHCKHRFICQSC